MINLIKVLLIWLLAVSPTLAADNAVTLTAGSGVTMRTKDIGAGVQSPYNILGDTSGAAIYGTAGSANANVITVQGIASGVAQPVSLTSTTITGTVAVTQSTSPWIIAGGGTAGSAATGVVTVQGIASGTVIPVSLTSTTITGTVAATQSGTWTVQPGNTPNSTPWLVTSASATAPVSTMNSSTANGGMNSAVAGVFDDSSPTSITENSFGFLRMSANRNLYGTIRDAAGNERGVNVDSSNRLTTAPSLVSGSVASGALASGSIASGAMVDLLTFQGTKAAGTAAANSLLTGAVFNSSAPTLTNGQQAALQATSAGALITSVTGTVTITAGSITIANVNNNGQATAANSSPVVLASDKNVSVTPYPISATPYTTTITGSTAATTATLAGASSVTTYICGFSIRANATAAATGNAQVTGTISGSLNFTQWTAPLASGLGVSEQIFSPCIPASATNTSIAVVSAAPGSGGTVSVSAWGYKL